MTLLEKIFRNNYSFYIVMGIFYTLLFVAINHTMSAINQYYADKQALAIAVQQKNKEITTIKQELNLVEKQYIKLKDVHIDIAKWCVKAEELNKGWKCPEVTEDVLTDLNED